MPTSMHEGPVFFLKAGKNSVCKYVFSHIYFWTFTNSYLDSAFPDVNLFPFVVNLIQLTAVIVGMSNN